MEANDHFNFTGLPPAPAASGLKPSPSSGEGLYTNGSPMNFPQQGKSECEGHMAWGWGGGIFPLEQVTGTRFGFLLGSYFTIALCQVGREEANPQNSSCWKEIKLLRTNSRGLWKQHFLVLP